MTTAKSTAKKNIFIDSYNIESTLLVYTVPRYVLWNKVRRDVACLCLHKKKSFIAKDIYLTELSSPQCILYIY